MKKVKLIYRIFIILIGIFILTLKGYTQPTFVSKDLGSGVSVKFPYEPVYALKGKAGVYTAKTDNCLFVAIVQYDVIPKYQEFVNLPQQDQQKYLELFLDNLMKGILMASGNDVLKYNRTNVGRNSARETSFIGINPANGQQATKHCKVLYAFNKAFTFQVMKLKNGEEANYQTKVFLNSIEVR